MQLDRYRKISCQIWLDQKFLDLSDDAKLVFLLVLTHPNLTSFGAMKVSPASLTDELGWLTERLSEAFQEVLSKGFAKYDPKARLLVLNNFIKHNKPASPNVVISWAHGYKSLPECQLKDELFHMLKDYAEGFTEGFGKAFRKAFGKGVAKAVGIQGTGNREQIEASEPKGSGGYTAEEVHAMAKNELWMAGKSLLVSAGLPEKQCGSFIGKLVKDFGDLIVVDAVRAAVVAQPANPIEYLQATCKSAVGKREPANRFQKPEPPRPDYTKKPPETAEQKAERKRQEQAAFEAHMRSLGVAV